MLESNLENILMRHQDYVIVSLQLILSNINNCEVSIAHEDQCVHSIVANDMMYINEQFDFQHNRCKYVSSEYKL